MDSEDSAPRESIGGDKGDTLRCKMAELQLSPEVRGNIDAAMDRRSELHTEEVEQRRRAKKEGTTEDTGAISFGPPGG